MVSDTNILTAYRAVKAVWNGVNGSTLRALFTRDFEFRNFSSGDDVTDLAGLRLRIAALRAAHPGARLEIEDAIGSGEHVALWWRFQDGGPDHRPARNGSSFPTTSGGTSMIRLEGGQVAEIWEMGGELVDQPLSAAH